MWSYVKTHRLKLIAVAGIAVVLLTAFVVYSRGLIAIGGPDANDASPPQPAPDVASRETDDAVVEHTAIIAAILKCHDIYDVTAIPTGQQPVLHIGDTYLPPEGSKLIQLNSMDIAIAHLSKTLIVQRAESAVSVESAQRRMLIWQCMVISVGAISTILVSLSSRNSTSTSALGGLKSIATWAVIASATATALASMSTFVGAQTQYANNLKTLSSLRQLHEEIATIFPVEYDENVCKSKQVSNDTMKNIQQWTARVSAILGASPSDNSGEMKASSTGK